MNPFHQAGLHHKSEPFAPLPGSALKLLVPREHGSWGMWLLPLIIGAIAGAARNSHFSRWALLWFCVAARGCLAYVLASLPCLQVLFRTRRSTYLEAVIHKLRQRWDLGPCV